MYRDRLDVLANMLAELQAVIPDVYTGEDGNIRIIFEIEAGQLENLYLAHQLLLEDMFPQTASLTALKQHGVEFAVVMKDGTRSTGTLLFEGEGGAFIPVGTQAAYVPGENLEPIYFTTTLDAQIPDPGDPNAPTAAINATAGNLNGMYEYVVTFLTAAGETLQSPDSAPVSPVNQQVNLTNIPLGGTGTTSRKIYRDKDGAGVYRMVATLANNTATTYTDNITDAVVAASALVPTVDTAHQISAPAQSEDTGNETNVLMGAINELTSAPTTLTAVTNLAAFTGGSDPEDTNDYRSRVMDRIQNPESGSPADLVEWAEDIVGVESATVFENSPGPGQVQVRISGPNGSIPTSTVISQVQAELDAKDVANIQITVLSFTPVPTNVTVDVTTTAEYTLSDITPSVQQAITGYINNLQVGETFYISGVIAAVKPLVGILDVTCSLPATNLTTAATDKRTPGTLVVT